MMYVASALDQERPSLGAFVPIPRPSLQELNPTRAELRGVYPQLSLDADQPDEAL